MNQSRAVVQKAEPAGWRRWSFLSVEQLWDHIWGSGSSFGVPSTRQTWVSWSKSKSSQRYLRDWSIWQSERLRKLGLFNLNRESLAGFSPVFTNVSWAEVKKMYSDSSHWCSVKGWMIYNTFPLNTSEQLFNSKCCHMLEQFAQEDPGVFSACSGWPSFGQEGWTPDSSILRLHKCKVPKGGMVWMHTCP